MNTKTRPQEKIAIVVFSYYPHDLRIRRAAEAAIKGSYQVDLFCLKARRRQCLALPHAFLLVLSFRL
jgi:hypothetical protein